GGSTAVSSKNLQRELQEAIAAGRSREVFDRLQESSTKSLLTGKEIEDLTELNTKGWLQQAEREFIHQRYDQADRVLQTMRQAYPGHLEARQLGEQIQQKLTEQMQLRQQLGAPVKAFEQAIARH